MDSLITREDLRRMRDLGYRRYPTQSDGHRPSAWERDLEDGICVVLTLHRDDVAVWAVRYVPGRPSSGTRYCFRSASEALDGEPLVISALRTMAGVISATTLVAERKGVSHG